MSNCVLRTPGFAGLVLLSTWVAAHPGWAQAVDAAAGNRAVDQQAALPELTAEQQRAMQVINERTVRGTVSFLASDALGGRGTPSPGYDIACAYVASRFEAAGLKGIGEDGSFLVSSELETVRFPESIRIGGDAPVACFGLLAGQPEAVRVSGPVTELGEEAIEDNFSGKLTGPVLIRVGPDQPGDLRHWLSVARDLESRGAGVLLLEVDEDHELANQARQQADRPRWIRQVRFSAIPVVLVGSGLESGSDVSLEIPPLTTDSMQISSVIGVLPGSDPEWAEQAVVFSAHLDHLGTRDNGQTDRIYNGADDNASGVTGVLSLADAFGALETAPARTTLFMAFWGEEMGLLGSRQFVEQPDWPLDRIVAVINLEMIGRPEPGAREKAWMTGWQYSSLGSGMAAGSARAGVEIFEHPSFSNRLYRASDNWPFVQAGVVAHSFSAGSLHDDYHQPGDRWEKLETQHMTRVIQGLFAGALPITEGTFTPVPVRND